MPKKLWIVSHLGPKVVKRLHKNIAFQDAEHRSASGQILESIEKGEWFTSIDLQDAYFHMPICLDHRPFLCFVFQGQAYQGPAIQPFPLTIGVYQGGGYRG